MPRHKPPISSNNNRDIEKNIANENVIESITPSYCALIFQSGEETSIPFFVERINEVTSINSESEPLRKSSLR